MRILIVQPATNPHVWGGDAIFVMEPLWAEYLGAALKQEHDVQLLDLRLGGSLAETQASFEPDLIAMTAYTVDVNTVKRLCRECKFRDPKVRTVVGGYHANLAADDLVAQEIDLVIIGEGVFTMVEVARAYEQGAHVEDINGVAIPTPKGLRRANPRPWPSLDAFPFPDRSLTAGSREHYFDKWMKPIASIRGSYGCPYRCEFCILWPPTDGKYLFRSPESFVDELATIEETNVFLTDDEALIQPARMAEIARLIEERGIQKHYYFMARSDSIRKHRKVFEKWASIGLKRVLIGLESRRPEDLDDYNKQATVQDNDEAIAICEANGVEIQAMFVLHPDYQREDFAALQKYVDDHGLDTPVYCILTPFPGTKSNEHYKDSVIVENYDYWDLLHAVIPTQMPLREYYAEYAKLWGTIPALQRGILAHRDELPADDTLANVRKMRQGFRTTASE
ncbi:MAG: radical SAM protein [bacterium]